ncbi:c-type cytochrome [Winogradskyella tangerina]|uniref:c-type cytochrome n=1 Tax=Winogradskyella tangerina TaxID=2023240 RepID=UPI000DBE9628|nr:cytochrome c [Winogradskyella tangerina]
MKKFILIFIFVALGGLYLFFFILKPIQPEVCGTTDPDPFFCGTKNLSINAHEGRSIFNANCAACHKVKQDMTGPALKDMGKSYDTLTIVKYLHGDKSLIESKNYDYTCPRFPQLTREDIANIIKYTDEMSY